MCSITERKQSLVGSGSWSSNNGQPSGVHQQTWMGYVIISNITTQFLFLKPCLLCSGHWPDIRKVPNSGAYYRNNCKVVKCFLTQVTGRTTSSSVWRTFILSSQHRPCGTTLCVVNFQALYLRERLSLCIVMTTYRSSDTSSFSFHFRMMNSWTSVSWKLSHQVCDYQYR